MEGWCRLLVFAAVLLCVALRGAAQTTTQPAGPLPAPHRPAEDLERVAEFGDRQVTGVTVDDEGRVFVCFPNWGRPYEGAVAEVLPDGTTEPYPDRRWNAWRRGSDMDPGDRFVCVQSVVADGHGYLWVLDPGAPSLQGPIAGAAKLVKIDLSTDEVAHIYPLGEGAAPRGSYLNDVRVDIGRGYAYMTDSNLGAIVVLNLDTGQAFRVLEDHRSTKARDVVPTIGGRALRDNAGEVPQIHSDGIALSADGQWLYYHALTGYHLYRVPTAALRGMAGQPELLAASVEDLGPDVICDGILLGPDGSLYLTALEHNAIVRRSPEGNLATVLQSPDLQWPDTLAFSPAGDLYITTSQIHLTPRFHGGSSGRTEPYALWRIPDVASPRGAEAEQEAR